MAFTEKFTPTEEPIIIEVDSKYEPDREMYCLFDGTLMTQQQVDYKTTLHKQNFIISNVWAAVCPKDNQVFLQTEVEIDISNRIFEIAYPREAAWAKLMRDDSIDPQEE